MPVLKESYLWSYLTRNAPNFVLSLWNNLHLCSHAHWIPFKKIQVVKANAFVLFSQIFSILHFIHLLLFPHPLSVLWNLWIVTWISSAFWDCRVLKFCCCCQTREDTSQHYCRIGRNTLFSSVLVVKKHFWLWDLQWCYQVLKLISSFFFFWLFNFWHSSTKYL